MTCEMADIAGTPDDADKLTTMNLPMLGTLLDMKSPRSPLSTTSPVSYVAGKCNCPERSSGSVNSLPVPNSVDHVLLQHVHILGIWVLAEGGSLLRLLFFGHWRWRVDGQGAREPRAVPRLHGAFYLD
nr:uncharacterized protein LOC127336172 [Lolium perenne]